MPADSVVFVPGSHVVVFRSTPLHDHLSMSLVLPRQFSSGLVVLQFVHSFEPNTIRKHLRSCPCDPTVENVKVQFLENVWDRGKYSLSEREYLWNKRLKGTINIQKVLSK